MLILIAASLASATPVAGASAPPPAPPASARIVSQLDGYAAWLARLTAIQEPVQAELTRFGAEMQALGSETDLAGAAERLRPGVARGLAAIDRANAALRDLGAPEFPELGLDEDLRTTAVLRETIALNGRIRVAIEGVGPMLDAVSRHDDAATLSASTEIVSSFRLVIESKVVLARAALATMERDTPEWDLAHIDLLSLQAIARVFAAYPRNSLMGSDPTLARDLASLAHQLELGADSAAARIEAELNRMRADLAEAERNREADYADVLRRNIAILTIDRDAAPIARDMALALSVGATSLDGPSITTEQVSGLVRRLQPVRMRFLALIHAENAALQRAH